MNLVQHDKVRISPVQDTGQRRFPEVFHLYFYSEGIKADLLCRMTNGIEAHTLLAGFANTAQPVDAVLPAILLSYHTQAGSAAVHEIKLFVKGKTQLFFNEE